MAEVSPLYEGERFAVYSVSRAGAGKSILRQFLEACPLPAQKKLHRSIVRLGDRGPHPSVTKCRVLGDGIYELKEGAYRIMFFYLGKGRVVLTHGFKKQSGPRFKEQKDRARRLKTEVEDRYAGWM